MSDAQLPINCSSGDDLPHRSHTAHLFVARHVDGASERRCERVDVVWIDDDGLLEFLCRACQGAQHKDTVLVVPGGDELLCNEIHSIVQRADDAEVREPVERDQTEGAERRGVGRDHRRSSSNGVAPVHLGDPLRDLGFDRFIAQEIQRDGTPICTKVILPRNSGLVTIVCRER